MSRTMQVDLCKDDSDWMLNNGYIGIPRITGNGSSGKDIVMNGVFLSDGKSDFYKRAAAFHTEFELHINKQVYHLPDKNTIQTEKTLDLYRGICTEEFQLSVDGRKVTAKVETFVSQLQKELFCSRLSVESADNLTIRIAACLKNAGRAYWVNELEQESEDAVCLLASCKPSRSVDPVLLCCGMGCWSDEADLVERKTDGGILSMVYEATTEYPVTLEQMVLCFSNSNNPDNNLPSLVLRAAGHARDLGYASLLKEEEAYWSDFWSQSEKNGIFGFDEEISLLREVYSLNCCLCGEEERLLPMIGLQQSEAKAWETAMQVVPFLEKYTHKQCNIKYWLQEAFDRVLRSAWKEKLILCRENEKLSTPTLLAVSLATVEKCGIASKAMINLWEQNRAVSDQLQSVLLKTALLSREAIEACEQQEEPEAKRIRSQGLKCIRAFLNSSENTTPVVPKEERASLQHFYEWNAALVDESLVDDSSKPEDPLFPLLQQREILQ